MSFDLYDSLHINEELENFWSLHEMRWKNRGLPGVFVDERKRKFYYNIAYRFSEKNWLKLWFLKINSKPVAALFGFQYNNKIYALQAGFDPKWSKYSIGQVLLGKVAELISALLLNSCNKKQEIRERQMGCGHRPLW